VSWWNAPVTHGDVIAGIALAMLASFSFGFCRALLAHVHRARLRRKVRDYLIDR
jgi:hypothetical protein